MVLRNSILAFFAAIPAFTPWPARADDMSDMAKWCATEATAPSSVVICSDLELRRMAVVRNKIFADARANLAEDEMRELTTDQNRWIHEYTAACGVSVNGPPVSLPVSSEVIDCYRRAGRQRVAELVRDLREVIPSYQIPAVTGSAPKSSTTATKATFKVIGIPSNDVLNIREQPTSQSRIVGAIPPNGTGIVYEDDRTDDGRWFFVRFGGTTGWVASRYLQEEFAASPALPSQTDGLPPPVSSPEQEERAREAEKLRHQLQKQAAEEQLRAQLKEHGYQLLEPADLDLDWKALMANNTKVAVRGTYVETNDVEVLSTPDNKDQPTIRLYTDDASREARKRMLDCRNSNFAFSSCEMVVGATIQSCIRNKGDLNEKQVPCLRVQEAYLVP